MAGSKKWFVYTTDDGTDFALNLDESNTEAVNGATQDFLADSSVRFALPRNMRPRYAVFSNADKTRNITCIALTPTIYTGVPANVGSIPDPLGTGPLALTRIRPERITLPFGIDTGLADGDDT